MRVRTLTALIATTALWPALAFSQVTQGNLSSFGVDNTGQHIQDSGVPSARVLVGPVSAAASGNLAAFNGGTAVKDSKLGVLANGGLNANITQTGGSSTTGVAGRYMFVDVNSAGTLNSGAGAFLVNADISGASLFGDRSAMAIVLNQSTPIQTSTSPGYNYSGANIYSQMNYNVGGSNSTIFGTSVGQNFGANIIAQLGAGATHYGGNVGVEVDVQTVAGSSVFKQVGIYAVKIGPTSGTLDAAIAVDAQPGGTWKTGLDLGLASNPYDINSTIIGCLDCGSGVKNGLYWPGVTFTDWAFKFGGAIAADPLGNISIAGSSFVVGTNQPFIVGKGGQGSMLLVVGPANPTVIANQITMVSTATLGSPAVTATGTDPNINLALVAKGTGAVSPIGLVNLSLVTNGGASSKTVCVDVNGLVIIKAGAC